MANKMILLVLLVAFSGGILTGCDQFWLIKAPEHLPLDAVQSLNKTQCAYYGFALVAPFMFVRSIKEKGFLKANIFLIGLTNAIGWFSFGLGKGKGAFSFLKQMMCGFSIGMNFTFIPMIVLEISPPRHRGKFLLIYWISQPLGSLYFDIIFRGFNLKFYQTSFFILPISSIIIVSAFILPETPIWQALNVLADDLVGGKVLKALKAYGMSTSEQTMEDLMALRHNSERMRNRDNIVLCPRDFVKPLKRGVIMVILQYITGFTLITRTCTILFLDAELYCETSIINAQQWIYLTAIAGCAFGALLIDSSRLRLLLCSALSMYLSIIVIFMYYLSALMDYDLTDFQAVPVIAMYALVFFYWMGIGSVSWVYIVEIMPPSMSYQVMTCISALHFLLQMAFHYVFWIEASYGLYNAIWLYMLVLFLMLALFISYNLPVWFNDPAGLTMRQIWQEFKYYRDLPQRK